MIKIIFPDKEKILTKQNRELRSLVWLLVSVTLVCLLVTTLVLIEYDRLKTLTTFSGKTLNI